MEIKHRPTMLMILDGFGINPNKEVNAIKYVGVFIQLSFSFEPGGRIKLKVF